MPKLKVRNQKITYNTEILLAYCNNQTDPCVSFCCDWWGFQGGPEPSGYTVDADEQILSFDQGTFELFGGFMIRCPMPYFEFNLTRPTGEEWILNATDSAIGTYAEVNWDTELFTWTCPPDGYEGQSPRNTWNVGVASDATPMLMGMFMCCVPFGEVPDIIKVNNLTGKFISANAVSSTSYPPWDETLTLVFGFYVCTDFPCSIATLDGKFYEATSAFDIAALPASTSESPTYYAWEFYLDGGVWRCPCGPWNGIIPPFDSGPNLSAMPVLTIGAP